MKIRQHIATAVAAGIFLFGTQAMMSCSGHEEHEEHDGHHHHSDAEHHEDAHADGDIIIEPDRAAEYGIGVTELERQPFSGATRVWGEIEPAPLASGVASATSAGIVSLKPGISVGEQVKAGMVIATVSGKDMAGGDATATASAALQAAQREFDRLKPLFDQGLATAAEYNAALNALETARSAMPRRGSTGGSAVAPVSGVITQLLVTPGQYVEAGQAVAAIASSSRVTLRADMPARLADRLPLISDAVIITQSGDAIRLSEHSGSRVSSASDNIAQNGYIPVYFSFDNDGSVIPGTAVEVCLVGAERTGVLAVPVDAVGEQQGKHFVYVKTGDHSYRKRYVTPGESDGQAVELTQGVTEGDIVVTQGSVYVRLAESTGAVPEGHSHNH